MVNTHVDYLDRLLEFFTEMNTIARVSFQTAGFENPFKVESYNLNVYPLKLVRRYETYNFGWIKLLKKYTFSIRLLWKFSCQIVLFEN